MKSNIRNVFTSIFFEINSYFENSLFEISRVDSTGYKPFFVCTISFIVPSTPFSVSAKASAKAFCSRDKCLQFKNRAVNSSVSASQFQVSEI